MAEIITILSGNGGMGKSFFACNLAYALKKSWYKVLLVELSFGSVSHDIIMGAAPVTVYNIADVCMGICTPAEAVSTTADSLLPDFISASPSLCEGDISVNGIVKTLSPRYDYIIFDAASTDIAVRSGAFELGGRAVFMTDDSPVSMRNTALAVSHIRSISKSEVYLLLTKVIIDNDDLGISAEDIIDECSAPLIGIIPYDEHAARSISEGRLIFDYNTYSSRAVANICERLLHNEVHEFETGISSGFFKRNKFILK